MISVQEEERKVKKCVGILG